MSRRRLGEEGENLRSDHIIFFADGPYHFFRAVLTETTTRTIYPICRGRPAIGRKRDWQVRGGHRRLIHIIKDRSFKMKEFVRCHEGYPKPQSFRSGGRPSRRAAFQSRSFRYFRRLARSIDKWHGGIQVRRRSRKIELPIPASYSQQNWGPPLNRCKK